jgi:hypothetical protein
MHLLKKSVIIALFVIANISLLSGQAKIGLDTYSRYVWRGMDFGNAPSFQPAISFTTGGLSVGAWGAFSFASGGTSTYSENDLWASYAFTTSSGTFTINFTDYYFPSTGLKFFNYDDKGLGAHTLEGGLGYAGTEKFPISIAAYYNLYNDVDNSAYIQVSYPFSMDSVYSMTIFAGGTPSKSVWYAASKANLINIGFTVSKTIAVTESFSLPVSASYIINPELEQSYLLFGISL